MQLIWIWIRISFVNGVFDMSTNMYMKDRFLISRDLYGCIHDVQLQTVSSRINTRHPLKDHEGLVTPLYAFGVCGMQLIAPKRCCSGNGNCTIASYS